MAFQKIFHFNTSTNQQLENFLCVTESSHQKGFHLAQKGRFIVVQPLKELSKKACEKCKNSSLILRISGLKE